MKVPAEFEDVFQGVELTEREIGFLTWLAGWDRRTIENLKSLIQKIRATQGAPRPECSGEAGDPGPPLCLPQKRGAGLF